MAGADPGPAYVCGPRLDSGGNSSGVQPFRQRSSCAIVSFTISLCAGSGASPFLIPTNEDEAVLRV